MKIKQLRCYFILFLSAIFLIYIIKYAFGILVTWYHMPVLTTQSQDNLFDLNHNPPYPSSTGDNLFWFVQVSDLHFSRYHDKARASDFQHLCVDHLKHINPSLVLITGDLTDAKTVDGKGSRQFEDEWQLYNATMKICKQAVRSLWLDVKGNHDDFGMANRLSQNNLYNAYGISSHHFKSGVAMQYKQQFTFGSYVFTGIDLSPIPGPGRPFNFFGVVTKEDIHSIKQIGQKARGNLSIWFGHYPLTVTTTPVELKDIIRNGALYLCGHLHTLANVVPHMYSKQTQGFTELELGDWKDNRRYRILAVDHDIITFVDASVNEWPIILITNPKPADLLMRNGEKIGRIARSTHIRFLVFSDVAIDRSSVSIDNQTVCYHANQINRHLFTCEWNPKDYKSGLHSLSVSSKDALGRSAYSRIRFSLDGTKHKKLTLASLVLTTDFATGVSYSDVMVLGNFVSFVENKQLFIPLVFYSIYLCIGPNFIGELVPGSIGLCFTSGLYTNSVWIPGTLTYLYSTIHLLFFNVTVMACLGSMIRRHVSVMKQFFNWFFLALLLLIKLYGSFSFSVSYGYLAAFTSVANLWSIPFTILLLHRVLKKRKVESQTLG